MLNGLTPDELRLREFDKVNALESTFFMGRRILGYDFDEKPHRGICNFVDGVEQDKTKLLLDPRGCFKTSIISQAFPTRRIIKNPNIRILLDSVALNNSQDNLKVVRRHFEANAKIKELYGDFHSHDQTWNDTEFVVSKRTNSRLKEPTVRASGIDKVQIGPHYDLIILDDIHNRDNYRTIEQVQKVKEHIRLIFGLLDPGGEFLIGGHRWSYTDAYSMVMGDTDKPEEVEFSKLFSGKTYIHGAVNSDGSLYFPRVHTREHLERQRTALGIEMYSAMLMNEPVIAGAGQKFEQRFFKNYSELPCDRKDPVKMNWYLTVDPGGREKGNDNWVLFESGIDPNGCKYFTRYIKKIFKTSQFAEQVYSWWQQMNKTKRPYQSIGFETTGQQGHILDSVKEYLWETYHVALPFRELPHPPSEDSKAARIEAMAPQYEMGKIYHSQQMHELFGLEDQLLKFPKGEDDVADAAAMVDEVAKAPKVPKVTPPPKNLDEMIVRTIEAREKKTINRTHHILGSDF